MWEGTEVPGDADKFSPIETEEQARNWLEELVKETESVRRQCDFCPTVKDQRKMFLRWMIKRGESLGVLQALVRTGRLSGTAYMELRRRVLITQVPTILPGVFPTE